MKKFLSLILLMGVFSFAGIINVNAATLSLDKTSAKPGESVILTISNAKGNSGYTLSYDNSSLDITDGGTCGGSSITPEKIKSGSCNIRFSIKKASLTSDKSVSFILIDEGSNETASINLVIKANTTSTTTTTAQTNKSNDASLKSLVVKSNDGKDVVLSPSFSGTVYEYEATVSSEVKNVEITPIPNDGKATVLISNNANEELVAGETNKITITVTAEDGTQRPYILNIKREALTADATLKDLKIEEDESFELKEDIFTYTVKVKKDVKQLTISYSLSDENAAVEIEGNQNLKDGSKVRITVTAQDGTKKVYTLNVKKEKQTTKAVVKKVEAEKNPLIIMTLSIVAFGLIGGIIYVIKK